MSRTRLTAEDVVDLQDQIYDLFREAFSWRSFIPVNPFGKPPMAHETKFYTMKEIPDGAWSLVESNSSPTGNAVTGYEDTTVKYLQLIIPWQIHKNDIAISPNGRIRSDSIVQITKRMDKQIELGLISGVTVGTDIAVTGLFNTTGVNAGTDGNGNGMTEIYNLVKELKNKLTGSFYEDKSKWFFIFDNTIDGYLDLINATHGFTAREKLISNEIIFPGRIKYTANITPDGSDAGMGIIESDPNNFHCREVSNGIELHTFYDGAINDAYMFSGWLEWVGTLVVPRPLSISKNIGVASA